MCEEQCRKLITECYDFFIKEIKDTCKEFPKPEDEFNRWVQEIEEKAIEVFREKALG